MMPRARTQGAHRGKGKTKEDILLHLLTCPVAQSTRDVKAFCREQHNLQTNKNIYLHLKDLKKIGFLESKTKKGLDTEWSLKNDFHTAKAIILKYPQRLFEFLKTPYLQNIINEEFLADAIKDFVSISIQTKSYVTKDSDSKLLTEITPEQFFMAALENRKFKDMLDSKEFMFLLVNPKNTEKIVEILRTSPSATKFICQLENNAKIWSYVLSSLIKIVKPIMENTIFVPIKYMKEHGRYPSAEETQKIIDPEKLFKAFSTITDKDFFLERIIESLFVADIFQDNIIESDFVFNYLKEEMNLVTKNETFTP